MKQDTDRVLTLRLRRVTESPGGGRRDSRGAAKNVAASLVVEDAVFPRIVVQKKLRKGRKAGGGKSRMGLKNWKKGEETSGRESFPLQL